jgi:large subunit ribosomal protein L35Ae
LTSYQLNAARSTRVLLLWAFCDAWNRSGKVNTYHKISLLKLEDVSCKADTEFYLGKRVAYIYKVSCAVQEAWCRPLACVRSSLARPPSRGCSLSSSQAKTLKNDTKFRVIWGKVVRAHGTNGAVRATFRTNLPPAAMGATLRVMLYPSRV